MKPRPPVVPECHRALRIVIATLAVFLAGLCITRPAAADYQCFQAFADTFAWDYFGENRDQNYGSAPTLESGFFGDVKVDRRYSYLRFNLDMIPSDATVLSAELQLYLNDIEIADAQTSASVQAVTENWSESRLTWNNRPAVSPPEYDRQALSDTPGRRTWSVNALADAWVSGAQTNYGLRVSAGYGSPAAIFDSSEARSFREPRLCVEWTTSAVNVDLTVTDIEVTQGIQDLRNSVRLVDGKRTYVRVHVDSTGERFRTFAQLEVDDGNQSVVLDPINEGAGHIITDASPDREMLNDAFLFQLPTRLTTGTINLKATVNPFLSWRPSRYPSETNYANNSRSVTVSFEQVPRIGIIGYIADYTFDDGSGATDYSTPVIDFLQMIDWVKRAYPVSDVWYAIRRVDFGEVTIESPDNGGPVFTDPTAGDFNEQLAGIRQTDLNETTWFSDRVVDQADIRYYGMVIDEGGFLRGRGGIPGNTSSGPTGDGTWGWDNDGSYGDWYGAHELAHNFDRRHAVAGCGSKGDGGYPYEDGRISPDLTGDGAMFGFDIGTSYRDRFSTREQQIGIYGPDWRDVTSYCDNQWLGDFTYEALMDYFQGNVTAISTRTSDVSRGVATDRLNIVGNIDPRNGETTLQPIFLVPDAIDPNPRMPGEYDIVLQDSIGNELARYPFTPGRMESGPPTGDPNTQEVATLFILEMVPYVAGTENVVIRGPEGELARVSAGSGQPSVTVTAPNGGEVISADPVSVTWSGSDPDGDPLAYNVQFSDDGGVSWETVKAGITGSSASIPRDNLPSTDAGLFRVWASDGINTARDNSNAVFTLSTRPVEVEIVAPGSGAHFSTGQTVSFEANVFSPNYGSLATDQVLWLSSLDGVLGHGEQLSVTGLTPGVHDFALWANDGTGLVTQQVDDVVIVENPSRLPAPRNDLGTGPDRLIFRPDLGETTQTLYIDNIGGEENISWAAFPLEPWIEMQVTRGVTPAQVTVTVDTSGLEPGDYASSILFGSSDTGSGLKSIPVTLWSYERAIPDLLFSDGFE